MRTCLLSRTAAGLWAIVALIAALLPGRAEDLVYDGDGNRVRKIIDQSGVKTTILYLVDEKNPTGYAQVVEELESAYEQPASFRRAYTYGLDLISRVESDQSKFFYCHDGHGSVRFQTSANGAITRHYTYDAFGIRVDGAAQTAEDQYLYAGEHYDPDLGLIYLRARYYNPNAGRFWTMDTFEGHLAEPGSLHKYLYASADPVGRADPSGNFSLTQISVVSGITSATFGVVNTAIASRGKAKFSQYLTSALVGGTVGAVSGFLGAFVWEAGVGGRLFLLGVGAASGLAGAGDAWERGDKVLATALTIETAVGTALFIAGDAYVTRLNRTPSYTYKDVEAAITRLAGC